MFEEEDNYCNCLILYKNNKSCQVLFLIFSEPPVFSLFAVHFVDEHGYEDEEDEDDHKRHKRQNRSPSHTLTQTSITTPIIFFMFLRNVQSLLIIIITYFSLRIFLFTTIFRFFIN